MHDIGWIARSQADASAAVACAIAYATVSAPGEIGSSTQQRDKVARRVHGSVKTSLLELLGVVETGSRPPMLCQTSLYAWKSYPVV